MRWQRLFGWTLVLSLFAIPATAQRTMQVESVVDFNAPEMEEGGAWLKRSLNQLHMRVMTNVATAGDAYTVWFGLFNDPENCTGGPGGEDGLCGSSDVAPGSPSNPAVLYGNGAISTDDGKGGGAINVDAWLRAGETVDGAAGPCCRGILDPGNGMEVEVHAVVAEHPMVNDWPTDLTFPQVNHRFAVFAPPG